MSSPNASRLLRGQHVSEDQKSGFLFGAEAVPAESEDAFGLRTSSSQSGPEQIFTVSHSASSIVIVSKIKTQKAE